MGVVDRICWGECLKWGMMKMGVLGRKRDVLEFGVEWDKETIWILVFSHPLCCPLQQPAATN